MNQAIADWLKRYAILLTFLGALLSGFLSPFGLDNLVSAYAFLGAAFIFALAAWWAWVIPPRYERYKVKGLVFLLIVAIAIGWGCFLWWVSQPRFEITALDTLEADRNAYEVTDQLLWNYDKLNEFGVAITFTLEIVPKYNGKQEFGSIVALISGDGDITYEKELWPHFDSGASTWPIQLTLEELLKASGLQRNSDPPVNRFRPGDPFFQQAELVVQIARAADKGHPWATEHIVVRNAPWEFRSALVERDGQRALDVFIENLGGTGEFTVRYRLVRLKREIDPSSNLPEVNGTTTVASGNEPGELVRLERGQFFTDTIFLTGQLAQGRYLVEAYAVKKQNYVEFANPDATWSDINSLDSPWWFGGYPSNRHIFVVTTSEFPKGEIMQADVHADRSWQDTGVHVQRGDRIIIVQIGGAWSMWVSDEPNESDIGFHDANGVKDWFGEEAPLPQVCLGTLIARVGTGSDDIFRVGCWVEHTSQAEGNLYLAINDRIIGDNAGRLTVQIITPAEE